MAICDKCGAELEEGKKFCASCGTGAGAPSASERGQAFQQGAERLAAMARGASDETGGMDPADIQKNKAMGGLAYFLFFLPLVVCPESKYGRFHANQGLVYLLLCVAGSVVNRILAMVLFSVTWRLYWLWSIVSLIVWLPILGIGIIGLVNGFSGKAKELPFIGKFRLIK